MDLEKKLENISMLSQLECKLFREDIVDEVVEIVSFDELLSLVAWIHGRPTELVFRLISLHEVPDWLPHHSYWLHVGEKKKTTGLVYLNTWPEKLT